MTEQKNSRTVCGETDNVTPRESTAELVDFVQAQANSRRAKEVARLTGLSVKAVENMRGGHSGASAQTITTWCRNDAAFRAAYFQHCGGLLEGDPELLRGLTLAVQAVLASTGGK